MRIALSADHAGYLLKQELAAKLAQLGHDVVDLGTHSPAPVDYPDSAEAVAVALRDRHHRLWQRCRRVHRGEQVPRYPGRGLP
jgi:ribose 5-phosphate isomerase RpiB